MAKTGRKSIIINVSRPEAIEACINFAEAKSKGVHVGFDYGHVQGLRLDISGPKEKVNAFEHTMRSFVENELEDLLSGKIIRDNEDFDDEEVDDDEVDDVEILEEEIDEDQNEKENQPKE